MILNNSLKWYAYVLECSDNKYYVGIAYNLKKRFQSHFSESNRRGSVFTNIYKPIKCIATYDLNTESRDEAELYENLLTIHYAKIYGYENVAGGNFVVRDMLQRKRGIENCISSDNLNIHGKKYIISNFNVFEKITEFDFVFEKVISDINEITPYEFDFVYEKTNHIEPLKKRLLIILGLIYRKKLGRIVKIKLSCINRSDMTIDIPIKGGKFINRPMEEKILKLIELYYKNETDKPIDYLFKGKTDKSKSMGITDENKLIEEIKKSF
jgi:predicted GIY-YIG superfamily endonuclease